MAAMGGLTDQEVMVELKTLLKTVDFDVETERTVRDKLAKRLGCDVKKWKQLIKDGINAFLLENDGDDGDDDGQQEEEEEEAEAAFFEEMNKRAPNKRKSPASAATKRAPKKEKITPSAVTPTGVFGKGKWNADGEWISNLTDAKRVAVRAFKGSIYVDIREYYQKEGDWLPTKKGISLTLDQWAILKGGMDPALQKIQHGLPNHVTQLSPERKMQLRTFKGYMLVDIREFYEQNGEQKPSKKGISLNGDQLATLAKRRKDVDSAVGVLGGSVDEQPAEPAAAPSISSKSPGAPCRVDASEFSLPLGAENIRVSASPFNGKIMVALRFWEQKGGVLKPSYKGITLLLEQFETLMENAPTITQALKTCDKSLEISLSSKRKVTISFFSGKHRVDIREYINTSEGPKPTKKGISLGKENWDALLQHEQQVRAEISSMT